METSTFMQVCNIYTLSMWSKRTWNFVHWKNFFASQAILPFQNFIEECLPSIHNKQQNNIFARRSSYG